MAEWRLLRGWSETEIARRLERIAERPKNFRSEYDAMTVMIVLNVADRVVGIVVDGVSDVIRLGGAQIREVPELGAAIDRKFLTGIGTLDDRMLILLDIERLMTSAEMGLVTEALAA